MLVAWIILLYNRTPKKSEKPHAYHESMYFFEVCQWCGEPCFVGTVVSLAGYIYNHSADQQFTLFTRETKIYYN